MKSFSLIVLTTLAIGCNPPSAQNKQDLTSGINKPSVIIDTIKIKETEQDSICFTVKESNYPKVKGLGDKTFEDLLNKLFRSNFNTFIDSAQKIYGGCLSKEELKEYGSREGENGFLAGSFEILTKTDSIISIIQHFEGGRAKAWNPYSITVNCNCKNKIFYSNASFIINFGNDIKFFNKKIKDFFYQSLSDYFGDDKEQVDLHEENLRYLYLTDKRELSQFKFGIRNDSIVLVMEAEPTGSKDSYATYIIPIDKCKNIR